MSLYEKPRVRGSDMYREGTVISVLFNGEATQYVVLRAGDESGLYAVVRYPLIELDRTEHLYALNKVRERLRTVCIACRTPLRDHGNNEKCLYAPGFFEPWVVDVNNLHNEG